MTSNIEGSPETSSRLDHGPDIHAVPNTLFHDASDRGTKVRYDAISLINRFRESIPEHVQARFVKDEVQVFLNDDEVFFE